MSQIRAPRASQARQRVTGAGPGPARRSRAVLFFVLAGVAPLTVAAGVIPTAYQTTGLTGIPAAFLVIAVILGVFADRLRRDDPAHHQQRRVLRLHFPRPGPAAGVAAALVALLSYTFLQVGLYGALGPAAAAEAAAHLGMHAAVVGVGAGRLGRDHGPGPAARRHHRQGPRRPAHRRDRWSSSPRPSSGLAHPGGRAPELRHPLARRPDLGRGRARSACWPSSRCSASSGSSRPRCWPRKPATPAAPSRSRPTWRWA